MASSFHRMGHKPGGWQWLIRFWRRKLGFESAWASAVIMSYYLRPRLAPLGIFLSQLPAWRIWNFPAERQAPREKAKQTFLRQVMPAA